MGKIVELTAAEIAAVAGGYKNREGNTGGVLGYKNREGNTGGVLGYKNREGNTGGVLG